MNDLERLNKLCSESLLIVYLKELGVWMIASYDSSTYLHDIGPQYGENLNGLIHSLLTILKEKDENTGTYWIEYKPTDKFLGGGEVVFIFKRAGKYYVTPVANTDSDLEETELDLIKDKISKMEKIR